MDDRHGTSRSALGPALGVLLVACLAACGPGPARAADSGTSVPDPIGSEDVRVERVKPAREKMPTLRFLRDNRDFLRARFDLLREKTVTGHGDAAPVAPRYLDYQRLLAEASASRGATLAAADSTGRLALLESILQLGTLESQLDSIEAHLAAQRARLGLLQADFTGRQQTSLIVMLSGGPRGVAPAAVELTLEDGSPIAIPLSSEQRASLAQGGIVQLYYGYVEPRAQVVSLGLSGDAWPTTSRGYLTLDPARDRLTCLRLDLGAVGAAQGASAIAASSWRVDPELVSGDR
jgi:hypothetical protein